ncbi:unnamed protein product [Closterium sp. NIES-65]|nr:unnamed protein product [Closterium sp. NIES-65]
MTLTETTPRPPPHRHTALPLSARSSPLSPVRRSAPLTPVIPHTPPHVTPFHSHLPAMTDMPLIGSAVKSAGRRHATRASSSSAHSHPPALDPTSPDHPPIPPPSAASSALASCASLLRFTLPARPASLPSTPAAASSGSSATHAHGGAHGGGGANGWTVCGWRVSPRLVASLALLSLTTKLCGFLLLTYFLASRPSPPHSTASGAAPGAPGSAVAAGSGNGGSGASAGEVVRLGSELAVQAGASRESRGVVRVNAQGVCSPAWREQVRQHFGAGGRGEGEAAAREREGRGERGGGGEREGARLGRRDGADGRRLLADGRREEGGEWKGEEVGRVVEGMMGRLCDEGLPLATALFGVNHSTHATVHLACTDATASSFPSSSPPPTTFLYAAAVPEQLSKAKAHLVELAALARRFNRTLIVPRVGHSRVDFTRRLPFCAYFDAPALQRCGVHWVTEDWFVEYVRRRDVAALASSAHASVVMAGSVGRDRALEATAESAQPVAPPNPEPAPQRPQVQARPAASAPVRRLERGLSLPLRGGDLAAEVGGISAGASGPRPPLPLSSEVAGKTLPAAAIPPSVAAAPSPPRRGRGAHAGRWESRRREPSQPRPQSAGSGGRRGWRNGFARSGGSRGQGTAADRAGNMVAEAVREVQAAGAAAHVHVSVNTEPPASSIAGDAAPLRPPTLREYLPAAAARGPFRGRRLAPGFPAPHNSLGYGPGQMVAFPPRGVPAAPLPSRAGRDPTLSMCRMWNLAGAAEGVASLQLAACEAMRHTPSSFAQGPQGQCVAWAGEIVPLLSPVSDAPAGVAPLARTFPRLALDLHAAAQHGTPVDTLRFSAELLHAMAGCLLAMLEAEGAGLYTQ